jgi:hypothetical protein
MRLKYLLAYWFRLTVIYVKIYLFFIKDKSRNLLSDNRFFFVFTYFCLIDDLLVEVDELVCLSNQ